MKIFQFKEIHFVILIIVLTCVLYFLGNLSQKEYKAVNDRIPEINETFFTDSLNKEALCFILFYIDGSGICNEMKDNLEKLRINTKDLHIYKINAEEYPNLAYKYNISGVPNILIFRNGIEDKRIMGLVTYSNIEMIYRRQIK
ncbi:MAG: thioredoxin family protein [Prevotella sp.]|jgi:thioredoxin-like negative regulator of GroEL|nr:thioredoxin family protein [Prevotella sp.]